MHLAFCQIGSSGLTISAWAVSILSELISGSYHFRLDIMYAVIIARMAITRVVITEVIITGWLSQVLIAWGLSQKWLSRGGYRGVFITEVVITGWLSQGSYHGVVIMAWLSRVFITRVVFMGGIIWCLL